ncbi:MAG: T9SS type A sorting domain-containing protein [Flavobacteriales bacterium]|nr:T9SS type A sorting domain-containing protein [Flavobacteriales bacterium]
MGPFPFTTLDPSIGLVEESNGVRLYPNPTTGKIYVESAVTQDFEIRDAQGKLVVDGHLAVGQNIIDLANLAEGWYVFCSSTHAYPIILNR